MVFSLPAATESASRSRRSIRRTSALVGALLAGALAVATAPPARAGASDAGSWTQLGSDPGRTSFASGETTLDRSGVRTLHVAWTRSTGAGAVGGVASPPVVAGGVVYALSSGSYVSAFDATTGSVEWGNGGTCPSCWTPAAPAIADQVLIAAVSPAFSVTGMSTLSGISLSDQSTLWTVAVAGTWTPSPAVVGTVLYGGYPDCCTGHGGVEARDTATGERRWFSTSGDPSSSPVVGDGVVLSGPDALNRSNGRLLWERPGFLPSVIAHGHAFGTCSGLVCSVDLATGTVRWTATGSTATSMALANRALVASGPDGLTALDAMSGVVRWHDDTPSGAISLAGGVIFASDGTSLVASSARDGHQLVSVDLATPLTQPVIVDGFVYVGGQDGTLFALTS